MKRSDVVISKYSGEIVAILDVDTYNNLPNVDELFNTHDVGNIEDTLSDAKLCEDRVFLDKIKEFTQRRKDERICSNVGQ